MASGFFDFSASKSVFCEMIGFCTEASCLCISLLMSIMFQRCKAVVICYHCVMDMLLPVNMSASRVLIGLRGLLHNCDCNLVCENHLFTNSQFDKLWSVNQVL